jgi:hypothetical protein
VRIFNTAAGEKVVSVEHIPDPGEAEPGEDPELGPSGETPDGDGPTDGAALDEAPAGEGDAGAAE